MGESGSTRPGIVAPIRHARSLPCPVMTPPPTPHSSGQYPNRVAGGVVAAALVVDRLDRLLL
ncbi:hypothetical protein GCM10010123_20270 [Pilimelia anulata]|uniref:Uncharacterized protein n=1 Tax=Pilimelia anulata TaxID=53371 RepID=A0A8J3B2S2_9ACTN|nr:hypothetical protein GCM10010123_20270 [Pilimelia anulata]